MKLTSLCVYALRALVYLARHQSGGLVTSHTIAAAAGLSESFLRKALTSLAEAGVLIADRGPGGGFRLARPAQRITLLEVVEAVEGPVRGQATPVPGGAGARLDARLQAVCDEEAEAVRRVLRAVSVADLAGRGGVSRGVPRVACARPRRRRRPADAHCPGRTPGGDARPRPAGRGGVTGRAGGAAGGTPTWRSAGRVRCRGPGARGWRRSAAA